VGQKSRAGGHDMMAGGSLDLEAGEDPLKIHEWLAGRLLRMLGVKSPAAVPLLVCGMGVQRRCGQIRKGAGK
jgi:hypothetical protein